MHSELKREPWDFPPTHRAPELLDELRALAQDSADERVTGELAVALAIDL